MDPLSAGVFASIGSAFKFADVAVRIAEVGSENAVFVRTISVVRSDLEEVERLLSLEPVQKKLTATPGKLPWIKNAIRNTRYALNEIGKWVERARVEQESTGSIKFDTRVRWVFSDHEKLLNRKTELSACHQQLSNILGYLVGLEVTPSHPDPQECEDITHFDDILARHRRTSRPKPPKTDFDRKPTAVKQNALHQNASADPVSSISSRLSPVTGHRNPSNASMFEAYGQDNTPRSPSLASTRSPPGSPPPTYATAVSVDPFTYDARLSPCIPYSPQTAEKPFSAGPGTDNKTTWAHRSNFDGMAIPELAGDTVVFSATNSAGPVNPYELCASPGTTAYHNTSSSQATSDSLSEMLGDLRFPTELPSNDPGPPPGYPPWSRVLSDQAEINQTSHIRLRNRKTSETPPVVHRRPGPINSLSDSLLTVHELPPSLAPRNTPLQVPSAVCLSGTRPLAAQSLSDGPYQSNNRQRPSSYNGHESYGSLRAPILAPNSHYSAAPPASVSYSDYAAAFSAESTCSWGLDTQPKVLKTPRAQEPAMATRMQSQKRMMDLLGSIGT